MENAKQQTGVPENAFRELKKGEQYEPLMSPDRTYKEVTVWSVLWGVLMAVVFSAASAYLGLKVGQVFEAAIPITIIAIGVTGATHRKGALGENVIIQSIGACSGMIVAGAIFTLPALYILQDKYPEMTVNFIEVFIASVLGGVLGILFLIPFRKYFVKDMHGKYPFPEATASTQVLVSGEKGGNQALPLLVAGVVGGIYDFIIATVGWWNESVTSRCLEWGQALADKTKLVFKINTGAAVLGMGYIVGLKYALIICCGSVAVWWVIVPAISWLFPDLVVSAGSSSVTASQASAEQIFQYAKSIGIGGIAMAGIIGIFKSRKITRNERQGEERHGRSPDTKGLADENHCCRLSPDLGGHPVVFLFRGHGRQPALHAHRSASRSRYRFSLHYGCGQRHCDCRQQPRIRNDADDPHPGFRHHGGRRPERSGWHGGRTDYGRSSLHRPLHGRKFHHRLENRLLAGQHAQETRNVQVSGYPCISRHRGRSHHDIE